MFNYHLDFQLHDFIRRCHTAIAIMIRAWKAGEFSFTIHGCINYIFQMVDNFE